MSGLRSTVVRGALWTGGATAGSILLTSVTGLVLARLLAPADFGVQSALLAITAFFSTLVDVAIGTAVVQRREFGQEELSTMFWSALLSSAGIAALLALAAPLVARWFSSAALVVALPVSALGVVILGAGVVPTALLRQRLAFAEVARAQTIGALAGSVVALVVALAGGAYWALVGYSLATATVATLLVARACAWTPSRSVRATHLSTIRGYSGSMVAFQVINYWSRNLNSVIIGRGVGIGGLGFYDLAQRLIGAPLQLLTRTLAPLLHPTFAAMEMDSARQRAAYLELVRVTALFTFPLGAILWVSADPLVVVLAGEKWGPSVGVVKALALLAAVQPVNMLSSSIFLARDAAHVMVRCATIGAVAVVAGMLAGVPFGVAGVAWGYSIAYAVVAAPVSTLTAFRLIDGRGGQLARALLHPLAAALLLLSALVGAVAIATPAQPVSMLALMSGLSALGFAIIAGPTARRLVMIARDQSQPA